jgi:hypothetical protein
VKYNVIDMARKLETSIEMDNHEFKILIKDVFGVPGSVASSIVRRLRPIQKEEKEKSNISKFMKKFAEKEMKE